MPVRLNNLLPLEFPDRRWFEEVVRAVFEGLPGGPWDIKLSRSAFDPSRVSVEVRGPHRVMLTSVGGGASREEITERLRMFSEWDSSAT
jgi:hypothetical protein